MVKISKPALKAVIIEKAEVANTLDQKVQEAGAMTVLFILVTHTPPVDRRHLTQRYSTRGTWKPRIAPRKGQSTAR